MTRLSTLARSLAAFGLVLLIGCATSSVRESAPGEDPSVALEEARDEARALANSTLQDLYRAQPSARADVQGAAGYAVFSNFGMKILITGSSKGRGIAVDNPGGQEYFMRMAEFQAGLGFGVQKFRQVLVFRTQAAFDNFINSGFEFGGGASAGAQTADQGGAVAGAVSASPDVHLYQLTDEGLSLAATVKAAKYYRDRELD